MTINLLVKEGVFAPEDLVEMQAILDEVCLERGFVRGSPQREDIAYRLIFPLRELSPRQRPDQGRSLATAVPRALEPMKPSPLPAPPNEHIPSLPLLTDAKYGVRYGPVRAAG